MLEVPLVDDEDVDDEPDVDEDDDVEEVVESDLLSDEDDEVDAEASDFAVVDLESERLSLR